MLHIIVWKILQFVYLLLCSNVDKVREFIKAVYIDRKYAGGNNSEKPPRDMQVNFSCGFFICIKLEVCLVEN